MSRIVVISVILFGLGLPGQAMAYLDPGTGSAILQMAMAGILGSLFVLKTYWRRLMSFFSSKPLEETDAHSAAPPPNDDTA